MAELKLSGICKRFGATGALNGVDLVLDSGQVHALIGENGAGKSTLMKVLSGAINADEGTMELAGRAFAPTNPREARARGVGMIYQELSLLPNLTVAENIALGDEPRRRCGLLARAAMRTRARLALQEVGLDSLNPDTITGSLAISTQQLVEVAKATTSGARVLVFDEPTSSLAQADVRRLFALIERLRARGLAIVYISHFLEEVKEIATRYTVLRDGRSVGSGQVADVTPGELIALMVGRTLDDLYPRSQHTPGEAVLTAQGCGQPLVLHRGEVVGLAGLAGSGRTRLLRAIFALEPHPNLHVSVRGIMNARATPRRRWCEGLGMVSENRKEEGLALALTIAENMTLTRPATPARRAACARRWIDELGIRCRAPDQKVGELSGGNQQKVALARLLHHGVEVFVLDEPTRGIDIKSKAEIYSLIDRLARAGHAVLIASSHLPELLGVCDRIGVMAKGQLRPLRPVSEWTEEKLLSEALL